MKDLIKVRDISLKYGISPRALKYYEDMGLLKSTKIEDYAYRMYDEEAIKRLKQILILRKLNISIKDIKHIFNTTGSAVVLEILGKKVDGIDDEIALLHELKEIVLEFIRQINKSDFSKDSDVKLLYEKAKEIENQIVNVGYNGNPASINRLIEVTEKLEDKKITLPIAIRAYRQSLSAMRFIGKKYSYAKGALDEWKQQGLSETLEKHLNGVHKNFYEDGDALIGLLSLRDGFEYWFGYFTPEGTPVPQGFECEDFPQMDIGVCWIYGKEDEIFDEGIEDIAWQKLEQEGFKWLPDSGDWWIERYSLKRCIPDRMGYAISDICFFVK